MPDYIVVPKSALTATADAIKEKLETEEEIEFTQDGFKDAVEAIDTDGDYSLEEILYGEAPVGEVYLIPTKKVPYRGIMYKKKITKLTIDFTHGYGFGVSNGNTECIQFCTSLTNLTIICNNTAFPSYVCNNMTNNYIWIVKGTLKSMSQNAFRGNSGLTCLDLTYSGMGSFPTNSFYGDSKLATIIIRGNVIAPLSGAVGGAFSSTPFASGKAGGTLYVAQSLIDTYKEATNWSTVLAYEKTDGTLQNQILPIEGSIYETQYADGTPLE